MSQTKKMLNIAKKSFSVLKDLPGYNTMTQTEKTKKYSQIKQKMFKEQAVVELRKKAVSRRLYVRNKNKSQIRRYRNFTQKNYKPSPLTKEAKH